MNGFSITIDGVQMSDPQGIPLILNSGSVLSNTDDGGYSNFNGLLIKSQQALTVILGEVDYINHYQVPIGKKLYVTNCKIDGGSAVIELPSGFSASFSGSPINNPWILNSGEKLRTNPSSEISGFSGYLVDENYFAGCGGGSSSSASNANIDSLTQLVSNLDSTVNALTSLFVFGCTDPSASNYNSSSNINDGSCAYTPQLNIGDTYQGGIIFNILEQGDLGYVEGEIHGLIAAPSDQSSAAKWGCAGTNISGADGIYIGTGNQNTIDIYNSPCLAGNDAADICYNLSLNGYDDWFLPSKDELYKMWLNIGQGNALGLGNIGGFTNDEYWSSSEYNNISAWDQNFDNGSTYNLHDKNFTNIVRAIRAF
jgi:hypothetical protein